MPKAAAPSQLARSRRAPYKLRSASSTATSSMATALVSPAPLMGGWGGPIEHPVTQSWQHAHLAQYTRTPMMPDYSHAMQTPTLAVAPPQHSRQPSQPNAFGAGPWTQEMDDVLLENAHRLKWDQIAELFFGNHKSGNACRKRYARILMERREPTRWETSRVQGVIAAYNREGMRQRIWSTLADEVGEGWQDIERLCFTQGLRGMTSRGATGHVRRRSRAASHQSYISEYDHSGNDDGTEVRDDSGLGSDLQDLNQTHNPVRQGGPVSAGTYMERLPNYTDNSYVYSI